jgi:hypothetical protein
MKPYKDPKKYWSAIRQSYLSFEKAGYRFRNKHVALLDDLKARRTNLQSQADGPEIRNLITSLTQAIRVVETMLDTFTVIQFPTSHKSGAFTEAMTLVNDRIEDYNKRGQKRFQVEAVRIETVNRLSNSATVDEAIAEAQRKIFISPVDIQHGREALTRGEVAVFSDGSVQITVTPAGRSRS